MFHRKERFVASVRLLAVRWDICHSTQSALQVVKAAEEISPEALPFSPEVSAVLWVSFCIGLLPMPEPWMITKSASDFQPR
jgi:hypothetical protein